MFEPVGVRHDGQLDRVPTVFRDPTAAGQTRHLSSSPAYGHDRSAQHLVHADERDLAVLMLAVEETLEFSPPASGIKRHARQGRGKLSAGEPLCRRRRLTHP